MVNGTNNHSDDAPSTRLGAGAQLGGAVNEASVEAAQALQDQHSVKLNLWLVENRDLLSHGDRSVC